MDIIYIFLGMPKRKSDFAEHNHTQPATTDLISKIGFTMFLYLYQFLSIPHAKQIALALVNKKAQHFITKAQTTWFCNRQWKTVPKYFHDIFPNQLPGQLITNKMRNRDLCGLLSQVNSIQLEEVHNPVTFLANAHNWAIVLKLHIEYTPRSIRYQNLLDYYFGDHDTATCGQCIGCQIYARLKGEVPVHKVQIHANIHGVYVYITYNTTFSLGIIMARMGTKRF
jgi:hypothetical protein